MSGPAPSNSPTILALLGLLAVAAGLLGLIALVLPQVFGFVAVVLGFFAFGAIHYLLWGWWLRPVPIEDEPDSASGSRARRVTAGARPLAVDRHLTSTRGVQAARCY